MTRAGRRRLTRWAQATVTGAVVIAAIGLVLVPSATGLPSGHGAVHAAAARPLADPTPLRPGESLIPVGMSAPYTPTSRNGASDDYRCFVLDPGIASDRWLTGTRFLPGNPTVVHHIILFQLDPDRVAAAQAKDAADPGAGWTCFGGPGLQTTSQTPRGALDAAPWLDAWAPGGTDHVIPEGLGIRMAAGSQLILQVHYNLRAGRGPDTTSLQVRARPGTDPMMALKTTLLAAPVELPCRPGERGRLCDRAASIANTVKRFGYGAMQTIVGLTSVCSPTSPQSGPGATQSCVWLARNDMTVYAAAPHMHLLGTSMTIEANPGTPRATMVLDVPQYDFDRQAAIWLAQPIVLKAGDPLRITCTWNTALRGVLPAFKGLKPRYVTWGEGTTDEMCLGVLTTSAG